MQAQIHTVAFRGIETIDVTVQIHLGNGLPAMTIVGLADKAVAESRERVRAALSSLGLALPPKRIAINLAPADVVKEGAHFDLPIAAGLMVAMGALPQDALDNLLVLGEFGLDGAVGRWCVVGSPGGGGGRTGFTVSGSVRVRSGMGQ